MKMSQKKYGVMAKSISLLVMLVFAISLHAQIPVEDIGVRNVVFQDSPMEFPDGTTQVGFEFFADDGVTLNGKYKIGCTVCLGALAFDFNDLNNVVDEMSGDGLWMWDEWSVYGTCLIGRIRTDLNPGTSGMIYFPVKSTEANDENEPYYSSNLVNINLQPHPYDPSYDSNDNAYGFTYTVPLSDCLENVFISSALPSLTVKASNQIKAEIQLIEEDPVSFLAGQEVYLIQGFEVESGTEFLADIKPCDP